MSHINLNNVPYYYGRSVIINEKLSYRFTPDSKCDSGCCKHIIIKVSDSYIGLQISKIEKNIKCYKSFINYFLTIIKE